MLEANAVADEVHVEHTRGIAQGLLERVRPEERRLVRVPALLQEAAQEGAWLLGRVLSPPYSEDKTIEVPFLEVYSR